MDGLLIAMAKKHTEEQKHVVIRNYQKILGNFGHDLSYKEVKRRIQNHDDGKKFDSFYYVLKTILHHKVEGVNYALGY